MAGAVCRKLVVAVTVPALLEVAVATTVQPFAGSDCPAAIDTCVDVTVTVAPVQVFVDGVRVTPAGMTAVKGCMSACAAATFGRTIVSVDVPPTAMVAGAKDIAIVDAPDVTVSGALAAGVVPAPVTSALVVFVTVPTGVAATPETAKG